ENEDEKKRDHDGQYDTGRQGEPGGDAVPGREQRRGICPDPLKGCLPERGLSTNAGQQHKAKRHDAGQPDVIEKRHIECRQHERSSEQEQHGCERQHATAHGSSSSSMRCAVSERQSRTGMISVKTIDSLKALAQNEEKDSRNPTMTAPIAATG